MRWWTAGANKRPMKKPKRIIWGIRCPHKLWKAPTYSWETRRPCTCVGLCVCLGLNVCLGKTHETPSSGRSAGSIKIGSED